MWPHMSSTCKHSRVERIFLTGFMGAGKTTVGRSLATALCWSFVDLDHIIEQLAGISISSIFAERGEEVFRSLETAALKDVATHERVVISTGGGIVVNPLNRCLMRESGVIVHLSVHAEEAMKRLEGDTSRPLLSGDDRFARIAALLEERSEAYADADMIVETAGRSPREITQDILTWIQTR